MKSPAVANSIINIHILVILFIIATNQSIFAQNDSIFEPKGNLIVQIINRTNLDVHNTNNFGMNINRAHFGYSYQFAHEWKGVVVLDAGRPTIFNNLKIKDSIGNDFYPQYNYQEGSHYTISLKFSYLEYKPNKNITIQAGGILQNHYIREEKFWGYRYIVETFPDRYFKIPSGDLGIISYFEINEYFSADIAFTNGEGFRSKQDEKGKFKAATGIDFKPVQGLISRLYYDVKFIDNSDLIKNEELYSIFIGYSMPSKFRVGSSYHYQTNYHHINNHDLFGFSLYGVYNIKENIEIFARYDNLKSAKLTGSNTSWNELSDGEAYIWGFHYSPVKGISLSLSEQFWIPSNTNIDLRNEIVFSFEYKL